MPAAEPSAGPTDDLLLQAARTIAREGLLGEKERIVVGLSGGPDSVALLHALLELASGRAGRTWELLAVHVHHGVRGEAADDDAYFARSLAAAAGAPFQQRSFVPGWVPTKDRLRAKRYHLLASEALAFGATAVAVGHHADDQAETVLFRIARGAALRGLAGIPYSRELEGSGEARLVRPLLDCTRDELVSYLRRRGVAWREDESNLDPRYTRNRIRHEVIPILEEAVHPNAGEALRGIARFARDMLPIVEERAAALVRDGAARARREGTISVEGWGKEPAVVIGEALRSIYLDAGGRERHFSREMIDGLLDALRSGRAAFETTWPGKIPVRLRGGRLTIGEPAAEADDREAIPVAIPGLTAVPWAGVEIRTTLHSHAEMEALGGPRSDDREAIWLDEAALRTPMEIRPWSPGERMVPFGGPSEKEVCEVLSDSRLPAEDRPDVPVLCDAAGILWLVGVRRSGLARIGQGSRPVRATVVSTRPSP